ncbi:MAG: hypothetical protein KKA73_26555 [Chloroflexi bacterium]|nr:hypothetical protein [Chloroflexota bacterium]MBU1751262.1 hypothetical protein [Chloroflexota bacterium]
MNNKKLIRVLLLGALALLLFLPGCATSSSKFDSGSPDWSRALKIGVSTLNNQPTMIVDDAGRAHMVWVAAAGGEQVLQYTRISPAGVVELTHSLAELTFGYPDTPHLVEAGADRLHLAWLTRIADNDHAQGFYHVMLDMDGQPQGAPRCLSDDGTGLVITDGTLAPGPNNGACAFWSSELGADARLYGADVDATGAVTAGPRLLVPSGAVPFAQTDDQGQVHLIWQQLPSAQADRTLYYSIYDPATGKLGTASAVTLVKVGSQNALSGPALGLTHTRAYVLWGLEARGKFAGSAQTYYLSWELGRPPQHIEAPAQLYMPTDYRPQYVSLGTLGLTEGTVGYTSLAAIGEAFPGYTTQPSVLAGQHPDLIALVTTIVSTQRTSSQPVVLTVFAAGEPRAYQIVTRSPGLSTRSVLSMDRDGNLYALWIHQAGPYNFEVYYASTAPRVRETLNAWTTEDVSLRSTDYVWNLGVALGFFPLAMVWVFASVIWLGLAYLIYGDVELNDRRGWIVLAVALALHLFSKYFSMPGMFTFVPFIDVLPDAVVFIVGRVLTPLLFSGAGLLVMLVYLKRSENPGAFGAYIAFALVDIVVSLLIYIPTLLGGG